MAPTISIPNSRLYPLASKGKPTYPPKSQNRKSTARKGRARRDGDAPPRKRSKIRSFFYQSSLGVVVAVLTLLLLLSAYGIGDQSVSRGLVGRVNIVLLAATYTAVAVITALFAWSRILTIKRVLRTMPKPYMPTKYLDLDKAVADHIMSEYSRTAVIAHISQATTGKQEGWGRPGTKWADKHFRTEILSTLPEMKQSLTPHISANDTPPLSLTPLRIAAERTNDKALIVFVNSYIRLIEQARYARREPDEGDAEAVMKVVEVVRRTMELRRIKEVEGGRGSRDTRWAMDGEG